MFVVDQPASVVFFLEMDKQLWSNISGLMAYSQQWCFHVGAYVLIWENFEPKIFEGENLGGNKLRKLGGNNKMRKSVIKRKDQLVEN